MNVTMTPVRLAHSPQLPSGGALVVKELEGFKISILIQLLLTELLDPETTVVLDAT